MSHSPPNGTCEKMDPHSSVTVPSQMPMGTTLLPYAQHYGYTSQGINSNHSTGIIAAPSMNHNYGIATFQHHSAVHPPMEMYQFPAKPSTPRVLRACANCKRSHHACGNERPCKRCSERGIVCMDIESKKRGRKKADATDQSSSPTMTLSGLEIASPTAQRQSQSVYQANFQVEAQPVIPNDTTNDPQSSIDFFHDLLFSSMLEDQTRSKKITHTCREGQKEDGPHLWDWYAHHGNSNEIFSKMIHEVQNSTPEFEPLMRLHQEWLEEISFKERLKDALNAVTLSNMKLTFRTTLSSWKEAYQKLGLPVIIWERGEAVHYYNDAYRNLTGYAATLPTALWSYEVMKQMTPQTRVYYFQAMKNFIFVKTINNWTIPAEILNSKEGNSSFIKGTFSLSIIRDVLDLPILFLGIFLPTITEPTTFQNPQS
eukprot:TRINITY_DN19276_c0_g1_i2.p1 TRINITY_DN19276_c0_g1~~TRINITY_DN19276_c0_g1_i2.p1  ORF type:complete len:427 (-),score=41.44 TRINITY_DN19276_c0_g1_i2:124-1404(-)